MKAYLETTSRKRGRVEKKYFVGYNIVIASCIIQGISYGSMFIYGIFFKEFQAEFGWSRATISGASSLSYFLMGPVGILVGRLNDSIGPRILVVISAFFFGFGYLLLSFISAPWQLYLLYGVAICIGFGSHDVLTLSTVARWFVKRRGMMSGVVKAGTGFGQLVLPMITTALIALYGWRHTYFVLGIAFFILLVVFAQLMRRDPRDYGLLPDNNHTETERQASAPVFELDLSAALRTSQFWFLCLAELFSFYTLITIVVHIVPHGIDLGLKPAVAAGILSTVGGVSMVSRIVLGSTLDRFGGRNTLRICFTLLMLALIWLHFATNAWMLYAFAVVYGLAHGGLFTVVSPTVAELFGTKAHGALFGIVLFFGSMGAAIGPVVAGSYFDRAGNYNLIFLALLIMAVIGFVLVSLIRPFSGRSTQ